MIADIIHRLSNIELFEGNDQFCGLIFKCIPPDGVLFFHGRSKYISKLWGKYE